ncbi:unnamed protein product, partial [Prorocentrum cordatum]
MARAGSPLDGDPFVKRRSRTERTAARRRAVAAADSGLAAALARVQELEMAFDMLVGDAGVADQVRALLPALSADARGVEPARLDRLRRNVVLHAAAHGVVSLATADVRTLRAAQQHGPRLGPPALDVLGAAVEGNALYLSSGSVFSDLGGPPVGFPRYTGTPRAPRNDVEGERISPVTPLASAAQPSEKEGQVDDGSMAGIAKVLTTNKTKTAVKGRGLSDGREKSVLQMAGSDDQVIDSLCARTAHGTEHAEVLLRSALWEAAAARRLLRRGGTGAKAAWLLLRGLRRSDVLRDTAALRVAALRCDAAAEEIAGELAGVRADSHAEASEARGAAELAWAPPSPAPSARRRWRAERQTARPAADARAPLGTQRRTRRAEAVHVMDAAFDQEAGFVGPGRRGQSLGLNPGSAYANE